MTENETSIPSASALLPTGVNPLSAAKVDSLTELMSRNPLSFRTDRESLRQLIAILREKRTEFAKKELEEGEKKRGKGLSSAKVSGTKTSPSELNFDDL